MVQREEQKSGALLELVRIKSVSLRSGHIRKWEREIPRRAFVKCSRTRVDLATTHSNNLL